VQCSFDSSNKVMKKTAIRHIKCSDELFSSYVGPNVLAKPVNERRAVLRQILGRDCRCARCVREAMEIDMQNDGDFILADELSDQEESDHGSVLSEDAASNAGPWELGGMETDEPTAQSTDEGMGIDDPMSDFEDDPTGVDELDESTDEDGLLG
jgi:hypothetical protein